MNLCFLGDEFKFEDFLISHYIKKVRPKKVEFINNLKNLLIEDDTIIITNKEHHNLVKEEFIEDTLFYFNNHLVNLIVVDNNIPNIDIPLKEYEIINIFKFDIESAISLIDDIFKKNNIKYTILKNYPINTIITDKLSDKIKKEILDRIPFIVFSNIFEHIVNNLPPKTITFAESCTGGLLAAMLTKIPNASKCFKGSVVTYANEIKNKWLGVDNKTLDIYGAVSEETIKEMLIGSLEITKSDYAIAISGIAGPLGATPTKPVGTVYIGVATHKEIYTELLHLKGNREYIQYQAVLHAVRLFINSINLYTKIKDNKWL